MRQVKIEKSGALILAWFKMPCLDPFTSPYIKCSIKCLPTISKETGPEVRLLNHNSNPSPAIINPHILGAVRLTLELLIWLC